MEYIRSHTTIPVPEIYAHDFRVDNSVGAQYILIESMPGRHLYQLWDSLSLDHKKIAISDIARVISQLQRLRFNSIGCLSLKRVGPLIYRMGDPEGDERCCKGGPFNSTLDYLLHFLNAQSDGSEVFLDVESVLRSHFEVYCSNPALLEPFRLTHVDFDAQNILFTGTGGIFNIPGADDSGPPRLSGVIDWEHACTGPLYYLYEYPIFIQDSDDNKGSYADNAILRRVFKRALLQYAPAAERIALQEVMKKSYTLNWFHKVFICMAGGLGLAALKRLSAEYVGNVRHGTGKAYDGRFEYVSDDDSEVSTEDILVAMN
jgi:Phosphotransferase enzyme family